MPSEPLPIEAHFAHVQEAYCAHVIVNKPSPEGPVERVSIVFRTRHNSPAAAVDEASGYAETIRLHPDRYHGLFQYVSKLIERERG